MLSQTELLLILTGCPVLQKKRKRSSEIYHLDKFTLLFEVHLSPQCFERNFVKQVASKHQPLGEQSNCPTYCATEAGFNLIIIL